MATSIDAVVGQRAIDAAREGGDADISGVTSRLGTPVDRLGAATILGDAGIPLVGSGMGGLSMAQSLASLARIDPQLARDIMSGRTYMAGTGLLGQGDMEDPLLQQISLTGNEQGDTIHLGMRMGETHDEYLDRIMAQEDFEKTLESITPTISKSLVKDAQEKLSKIYDKDYTVDAIRDRIQGATTDAVRSLIDPEEYDALPLDDILSGTQSFEVPTPLGTTDIFNAETGKWEVVDSRSALEKQLDRAKAQERVMADTRKYDPSGLGPQKVGWAIGYGPWWEKEFGTKPETPVGDDILSGTQSFEVETPSGTTDIFDTETGEWTALTDTELEPEFNFLSPTLRRAAEMSGLTMGAEYPSIDTTVQDTQADVMDEGYLAGLNMTAEESRALTRALNTLGRPRLDHEIEALKQGASIAGNLQTQKNLEDLQESPYSTGFLEGLSQAMKNVLENDDDLMAQYMAARSDIIAQLDKDKFEHEDWYPGSQAAATGAGYWGPLALGWNASYNDYKDAQRALMGKQAGQRFDSGDWINNLGWMTPEQINRLLGYGEP